MQMCYKLLLNQVWVLCIGQPPAAATESAMAAPVLLLNMVG